jgi:hypothetical protein
MAVAHGGVTSQGRNGREWKSTRGREGARTGKRGMEKEVAGKCNVKMITWESGI